MAAWLTKVVHTIRGQSKISREALMAAQRANYRIEVNIQSAGGPVVANASIELVRDNDFIISQPVVNGAAYMLAFGENTRISFIHASRFMVGHVRCLGRMKVERGVNAAGQRLIVHGYRMTLPEDLEMVERRAASRTRFHLRHPIEARLHSTSVNEGVTGEIVDISIGGARMILPARTRDMVPGETIYLRMLLPAPGGLIDELVKIVRVEIDPASGAMTLGLRFDKDHTELENLFRGLAA